MARVQAPISFLDRATPGWPILVFDCVSRVHRIRQFSHTHGLYHSLHLCFNFQQSADKIAAMEASYSALKVRKYRFYDLTKYRCSSLKGTRGMFWFVVIHVEGMSLSDYGRFQV